MNYIGGDGYPDSAPGPEQEPPSELTLATRAAMPGLAYLHDTGTGQMARGVLPDDHPYFPGKQWAIKCFYFSPVDVRDRGDGAWSVEVKEHDGTRLMIGSVQCSRFDNGMPAELVRPAKGAVLVPVEDADLEMQVASVLTFFAEGFTEFSAEQERQRPTRCRLLRGLLELVVRGRSA